MGKWKRWFFKLSFFFLFFLVNKDLSTKFSSKYLLICLCLVILEKKFNSCEQPCIKIAFWSYIFYKSRSRNAKKQPTANLVKFRFLFKMFFFYFFLLLTVWLNSISIILPCFPVGARVVEKLSGPVREEYNDFIRADNRK